MARWGRALSLLRREIPPGARVLDLGCAFGYGTVGIARLYDVDGLDASPAYIRRARRAVPHARFALGVAERLPYPDAHFDAVALLDVLEHVSDERAVVAEIARVLRPGGLVVVSVPHAGLLRWADSLNVYTWLTGEDALAAPGTPAPGAGYHRHYSLGALRLLFGERFSIDYVHISALGLAEWANLPLLLLCKRLLRAAPLYNTLQYLYFGLYILEDLLPVPRAGYHLMVALRHHPDRDADAVAR